MKNFGLIGYPLGHSFSKGYFGQKFSNEGINNCEYNNYPLEQISMLPDLINRESDLVGLNVTIPYKKDVLAFLDEIDDQAKEIGAVNTIKIVRNSHEVRLLGYNTDVIGFERPLLDVLTPAHNKALILGTGGASQAVGFILKKHGISFTYVSRNPKNEQVLSYEDITPEIISNSKIIVNCSPVGMHPNIKDCPNLPYCSLTSNHILYDLIYNPLETRFLKKGKQKKATIINGLPMLHIQAESSWEIWNS